MRALLALAVAFVLAACGAAPAEAPSADAGADSGSHPCACQQTFRCVADQVCPAGRTCDQDRLVCVLDEEADGGRDAGGDAARADGADAADGSPADSAGADAGAPDVPVDADPGRLVRVRVVDSWEPGHTGASGWTVHEDQNVGREFAGVPVPIPSIPRLTPSDRGCFVTIFRRGDSWVPADTYGPCYVSGWGYTFTQNGAATIQASDAGELVARVPFAITDRTGFSRGEGVVLLALTITYP